MTFGIVGVRGWRRIAVAVMVLVTLVVNLAQTAQTAHAADTLPTDYTMSFPIPADVDRATLQGLVDDINSRPGQLSDSFHEWSNLYGVTVPDAGFSIEADFDGVVSVSGSELLLTIEPDEAHAQDLTWWQTVLVYAATVVMQIVMRAMCVGFFAAASGGTATLPAITLCAAGAAFLQQFVFQMIRILTSGQQAKLEKWGEAFGLSLVAALGAGAWEAKVSQFAKGLLPKWFGVVGTWLEKQAEVFNQWWEGVGAAFYRFSVKLKAEGGAFVDALVKAWSSAAPGAVSSLRVLPQGDSITYGVGTSDNSSYRARLSSLLLAGCVDRVDYVGSQRNGTLADKDHEGHPGWTIGQIGSIAPCTIRQYRPNVVTLHIGTNDMARNVAVDTAPDRLRSLIRRITDQAPETTVLVSTLIPSTVPTSMNRIQRYNEAIPGIVAEFQRLGRFVHLVDMSAVGTADLTDSLHPNANGFRKMGDAFHRTISTIGVFSAKNGFPDACGIGPDTGAGGGTTGGVENPTTSTMNGWRHNGQIASGVGATRDEVRFADLNGDGRDDYLVVGAQAQVTAWFNTPGGGGGVSWVSQGEIASGFGIPAALIDFADIDGDRRDDYLVVSEWGRIWAWRNNRGGGTTWISEGQIATGVGATRDRLFLADFNGDLRDDYLVSSAAGVVTAWTNNGLVRKG
ncbi:GDSL-type esterase/lipase family protein [Herbidospora sp. RD11066]